MTTPRPTVLVVVPTLGERLDTLVESLASVSAQEGVDTHLVVVVPEAAEQARAIAAEHGATVVDDPRRGLSAAVNAGIAARAGETYYAWIGDDDRLAPDGLLRLTRLLAADPAAVVAYGACTYIDDQGRTVAVSRAGGLAARVLAWGPNLLPQPASLTRLDALVAAGPYDEALRFAMDLDMFLRLKRRGRFVSTREETAAFRWHADSLTVANRGLSVAEAEQIKRSHLSPRLRALSPLWVGPVRLATRVAAHQVSARARRLAAG